MGQVKRAMAAVVAVVVVGTGIAVGEVEAKLKVPPKDAVAVYLWSPTVTTDSRGNCNLSVNPQVIWYRHPKPKRPSLTKAHFMRVQTAIMIPKLNGGYWRPLDKKLYKTPKFEYPNGGLGNGKSWYFPLSTTVGQGSLDYRTRVRVSVVRDVKFSPVDVTIWKGFYWSEQWLGCATPPTA